MVGCQCSSLQDAASNPDATLLFLSGSTGRQDSAGGVSAPTMVPTESAGCQTVHPGASSSSSSTACPPVRICLRSKTTVSATNPFSSSTASTAVPASSRPVAQRVTDELDDLLIDGRVCTGDVVHVKTNNVGTPRL